VLNAPSLQLHIAAVHSETTPFPNKNSATFPRPSRQTVLDAASNNSSTSVNAVNTDVFHCPRSRQGDRAALWGKTLPPGVSGFQRGSTGKSRLPRVVRNWPRFNWLYAVLTTLVKSPSPTLVLVLQCKSFINWERTNKI